MKYLVLFPLAALLTNGQCTHSAKTTGNPEQVRDSIPTCLRTLVTDLGKHQPSDAPMSIDAYKFRGDTVYLFNAPCCDQFNELYSKDCQVLCSPSGGFTGRGDMKCAGFKDSATLLKKVWTNPVK